MAKNYLKRKHIRTVKYVYNHNFPLNMNELEIPNRSLPRNQLNWLKTSKFRAKNRESRGLADYSLIFALIYNSDSTKYYGSLYRYNSELLVSKLIIINGSREVLGV